VFFAGYRLDSVNYINACDVFVLPSIANEDMPLSLLTAMSLGKPIISTKFAGIAEAITDKENGLLIDPDPQLLFGKLYACIVALYTDATFRSELGNNAYTTFNKNYSEEMYAKKIISLYNLSLN
ncbi:MAG: glycosyltransferase family 4 protein, partial [Parafilimonas sp.]